MARKGGSEGWALLGLLATFVSLAWLISGRDENNSPLIPDALEDQIDLAIDSLNKYYGHQWVTFGLNAAQGYLERTQPHVAWLVHVLYAVEQQSIGWPLMNKLAMSQTKKSTAFAWFAVKNRVMLRYVLLVWRSPED